MASRLEQYILSVIAEPGRPGVLASTLRGFLSACAALYDAGLEAYLSAERLGLRRRGSLPLHILSIGNLSVGGTGKTPMTQFLCRRLQAAGLHVAVLSRGHGGDRQTVRLVSDDRGATFLTASEAGDEPVLLARTLPGVPILIGKDRRQSGREALRRFALEALVLDDGFQFWQLRRDLDIVLLDARRPFDNGFPLPRGLLREPKRHLRRAGIVVATRSSSLTLGERAALASRVFQLAPGSSLYFAEHRAAGWVPADDLSAPTQPLSKFMGHRVFAVSAIAQPRSFLETLTGEARAEIAGQLTWGDHHSFGLADAQAALDAATRADSQLLAMTEKDAVKWPVIQQARLPAYALRIEMHVENEAEFMCEVMARVRPYASQ